MYLTNTISSASNAMRISKSLRYQYQTANSANSTIFKMNLNPTIMKHGAYSTCSERPLPFPKVSTTKGFNICSSYTESKNKKKHSRSF